MKNIFPYLLLLVATSFSFGADPLSFEDQVDMKPWGDQVAVFTEGRVKSYETFARSFMPYIMGSKKFEGQDATFTYFDMMLRPERYVDKDIIYVKHKGIRASIIQELGSVNPETQQRLQTFMKTGLISKELIQNPLIQSLFGKMRRDNRRFASPIETIGSALGASDPRNLWASLKIVPPSSGSETEPWSTLDTLDNQEIIDAWQRLAIAWQAGDAKTTNTELSNLANLIPALGDGTSVYPDAGKLALESLYFRLGNLTWVWLVYLVSVVLLLMAFVYRFRRVGSVGMCVFILAVLLNTVAIVWRWYVSGRFPNANMFEAITTAAWMGGVFAVLMELFLRKSAMKYLFPLGAAITAMVALLAVRLYPLELNPHISNKMPVLHDVWLYIHVNFIIFAYCLIFVAAVSASFYLIRRGLQKIRGEDGVSDFARAGGIASLVEVRPGEQKALSNNMGSVLDGATMILVELSFILLWAGIVMGAIWADHSWGRPWGWDPKEVFALNTFLIFVVLIHARLKVKDKGIWTAWLALLGCAVMLFNWIIINFTISGLHSYA
ncbi:MAG: cytochrome c biogenesis protein CcsA [Phycisphaerales bacterium]|jgi:cytochrome c-type biogenesis protein CcsB|nr:cytochrome c biogenesis protein CcsA [Phycisphaerales bacterium]